MPTYTQDTRPFRLTTPLGKDVLLCTSWSCTESVSSLFELRVVAVSERGDITPKELLLKTVTLSCNPSDGGERYFTGIVRHVERPAPGQSPLTEYVLHVAPPAWLLSLGSGYEVHQDIDLKALLPKVLTGVTLQVELKESYEPAPSRTRYDESRWAFASRLFERAGIWYAFRHTASACTTLVADSMASATVQHGLTELRDTNWAGNARLLDISSEQEPFIKKVVVGTSQQALFKKENREEATAPAFPDSPGHWGLDPGAFPPSLETQLYEYITGGGFDASTKSGGDSASELSKIVGALKDQAKLHAQAGAAASSRLRGASTATALVAGAKVALNLAGQKDVNGQYFVLSVHHHGENGSYTGGDGSAWSYRNQFTCIPHSVTYRPPRTTPWPAVQGMHVATVIGPAGEEIFTDKFGRVRVAFEWNREAKVPNGPGDTCWVRVAQLVSGPGWGAFFLPRVGHQVLVSFLGGDPDQPVIVGSLYNDSNLPQIKLPDDKDQSALRTRSTPNGGKDNFNELRFVDKKGDELVNFQAEKDFKGLIKNKSTMVVDKGDESHTLNEGSQTLLISRGDQTITVKQGKQTIKVNGNIETSVTTGDVTTKVEAGKMTLDVKSAITIKSTAGKIEITSPMGIELKCGGSSIKITPAGVEISGPQFKASGQAMAEVSGGGMLTLKGGVVMIN